MGKRANLSRVDRLVVVALLLGFLIVQEPQERSLFPLLKELTLLLSLAQEPTKSLTDIAITNPNAVLRVFLEAFMDESAACGLSHSRAA